LPAGQTEQDATPMIVENFPAAHAVHEPEAVHAVPGAHVQVKHEVAPLAAYLPLGQAEHAEMDV
jgi:hypothetical protein